MGAKQKFKVGDIVRCISSDYSGSLTLGKHYTVVDYKDDRDINTKVTSDKGVNIWFYDYRFELVNSPEFKVGDRVFCVLADSFGELKKGQEYTIKAIIDGYIHVDESEGANGWMPERFKLVKDWNDYEADVKDEEILAKAAEATDYPDDNPKTILGLSKPAIHTVPPISIFLQGQAMMDGKEKYGLMNWRHNGVTSSVYYNAAMRHLMAWWDGQENASDSNVHHLGHALACLGIIVDAQHGGTLNDDRPKPGTLPQFIAEKTIKH